jgi:hypothetical protein
MGYSTRTRAPTSQRWRRASADPSASQRESIRPVSTPWYPCVDCEYSIRTTPVRTSSAPRVLSRGTGAEGEPAQPRRRCGQSGVSPSSPGADVGGGEPIQSRRRRAQRQSCQEDARLRRSQLRPVPAQHSHLRRFPLRPIPTSADALVKRRRCEHAGLSLALSGNGTSGSRRKREKTARRKWEIRMGTGARHDVALDHVRRRLPVHAPRAVHSVPAWTCEHGKGVSPLQSVRRSGQG